MTSYHLGCYYFRSTAKTPKTIVTALWRWEKAVHEHGQARSSVRSAGGANRPWSKTALPLASLAHKAAVTQLRPDREHTLTPATQSDASSSESACRACARNFARSNGVALGAGRLPEMRASR